MRKTRLFDFPKFTSYARGLLSMRLADGISGPLNDGCHEICVSLLIRLSYFPKLIMECKGNSVWNMLRTIAWIVDIMQESFVKYMYSVGRAFREIIIIERWCVMIEYNAFYGILNMIIFTETQKYRDFIRSCEIIYSKLKGF